MRWILVMVLGSAGTALGQTIDPFFAGAYSYADLGAPAGVPSQFGGLTLKAGDPNTLLLGGGANSSAGNLYAVTLVRDGAGHISGFSGTATVFATAPYNDGGVTYGPGGVLFASRWPVNELGEYLPGATAPTRVISLAPLGVASSHSAVMFVPPGLPGAGRMKLSSWSGGQFYDATPVPDGSGTYDVANVTQTAALGGGPEGFTYVPPGSPLLTNPSMLVSEYSAGSVAVYDVNATGDPIPATRRVFMSGLSGAEGAFVDPLTGDFLFSTFGGGNHVVAVRGFRGTCGTADFNCDGDTGTDADIEAFFRCIAGTCPAAPCGSTADFDGDGDTGTDADIEAFFRVLAGGHC